MAHTSIILTNGVKSKEAPIGFSWTTLLLGGWPAIFRGDIFTGIFLFFVGFFTFGLSNILAAFFYNKSHIATLLDNGYRVQTLPYSLTEEQFKIYINKAL
jgi:NADH:ubiquinone oxidoreductase subunit H